LRHALGGIRPGAANEGKKLAFTRRYQGPEPVTYPHPSLEPVLRDTFGLVVTVCYELRSRFVHRWRQEFQFKPVSNHLSIRGTE